MGLFSGRKSRLGKGPGGGVGKALLETKGGKLKKKKETNPKKKEDVRRMIGVWVHSHRGTRSSLL